MFYFIIKKMYSIIQFLLLFLPFGYNCKGQVDFNNLLEWGFNYSLEISDKIGMKYISENNRTFYVKKEIKEDEVILRIPSEILLTIESGLELFGKKTKKLFESFKNQKTKYGNEPNSQRLQQAFMAYLLYIGNMQKDSKKNKDFYNFYQYYFKTFESNLDSFPAFYSLDQLVLLEKTACGNYMLQASEIYKEEFKNLQSLTKRKLDYDEYLRYRTYSVSKGKQNGITHTIVPFLDMFPTHPNKFNLNFTFEEWGVKVFAIRKIKARKKLFLRGFNMSNCNSLILYGNTFDDLNNMIDSFDIALYSPLLVKEKKLDEKKYPPLEKVNLARKRFYKEILGKYKKISKDLEEDGSDLSAYNLFLRNLELLRTNYDPITTSEIHKKFYQKKDIESIKRIISTEISYYDGKIEIMKQVVNYTENGVAFDEGEDDDEPAPEDDTNYEL